MDFYADFLKTLEESDTPAATLEYLKNLALGAIQSAPARVGLIEGCSFLAALNDYKNPGNIPLLPMFSEVKMELEMALDAMSINVELADDLQIMEARGNAE